MPRALETLRIFTLFGLTAFGGPAAHVALFQRFLVEKHQWTSREEFLRMLGAVNLIPGPNSTETAMLLGYYRAGTLGLILAGVGFIVPAAAVTLLLVGLYQQAADLPLVQGAMLGLRLGVLAVVAQALIALLPHPVRQPRVWIVGLCSLVLLALGLPEWAAVVVLGLAMLGFKLGQLYSVEPIALFWFFLKLGSVLFGSGYALIGLMQEMVKRGWLGRTELLDALSLGQLTPGPLLTTATAAGYLAGGIPGAVLATVGIFLPSFIFSLLLVRVLQRLQDHFLAKAFLDGAAGAATGLIAWALWQMGQESLKGWPQALVTLAAFVLGMRGINPFVVLGALALGGAVWTALG
jgi:chromate transporter